MKKNIIALLGLILISVILAIVVRNNMFEKSHISNYVTLDVLQNEKLMINSYSTEKDFSEEDLARFVECECEVALERENVFVVYPTGNLYVNNSVIMQEVLVEEVIKGQCEYEKIWICSQGSSIIDNGDNTYVYVGLDYSLMQLENKYLVFCIPSEINDYSNKKIYNIDDNLWFSYYNITRDSEMVMEDTLYNENIEFYTDSELVLRYYNSLKEELFEILKVS